VKLDVKPLEENFQIAVRRRYVRIGIPGTQFRFEYVLITPLQNLRSLVAVPKLRNQICGSIVADLL